MPETVVLENEYATLWYYPEAKLVHHKFHKYIYGAALRQVLQRGLEIFKENGGQNWLSDDRLNSALPQSDIDWSVKVWIPNMIEAGWKYWAVVLPDTAVGQANMKRIIETFTPYGLTIRIFDGPDSAMEWLESV